MKLKTTILAIAAMFCGSAAYANEPTQVEVVSNVQTSFPYISIGLGPLPIPLPLAGAGYRFQQGNHGFDASLNGTIVAYASAIQAKAMYQYYFKPYLASQFYAGAGPSLIVGFDHDDHSTDTLGTVGFALGQQYQNAAGDNRFFQADLDLPVTTEHMRLCVERSPIITVKYGFGF